MQWIQMSWIELWRARYLRLSTPCNGFNTGKEKVGLKVYVSFQLHAMDSGYLYDGKNIVAIKLDLSTPCNGFSTEKFKFHQVYSVFTFNSMQWIHRSPAHQHPPRDGNNFQLHAMDS